MVAAGFAGALIVVRDVIDLQIVGHHDVVKSIKRPASLVRHLQRAVRPGIDEPVVCVGILAQLGCEGVAEAMLRVRAEELILRRKRTLGVAGRHVELGAERPVV